MTTTTPPKTATVNSTPRLQSHAAPNRQNTPAVSAEAELTNRIFQEGNGKGLMKFCRELAVILIRRYSVDDDATDLRETLVPSLVDTLSCSDDQANCLIDLSLEIIHAKIHGKYRRSDLELSYLIAMATGAVTDVAAN